MCHLAKLVCGQHRSTHYEIVQSLMVVDGWCRLGLRHCPTDVAGDGWRRLVLNGRGQIGGAIIRAVAAADEDALDRLIAEDMVDHNAVPGQAPGRVGIKYWMTMMHDVFADLTGVVEDTVVEGDKTAARVTWHGIHRGDFVGVPGTGTRVTMQSVQILRFADGMASEWWGTADVFGVLRQIDARVAALT